MIVNVWLVYKAGEPRTYTWTVMPHEEQARIFKNDGFKIFKAEIELPIADDSPVVQATAVAVD